MKLTRTITSALAWACVGTVALEGTAAVTLGLRGRLSFAKVADIVAAAYGVDSDWIEKQLEATRRPADLEQPSYEDILRARTLARLRLDLREMAVDKALADGRFLQSQLDQERDQYLQLRKKFDEERAMLEGAATDEALLEVQRTLVSLPPKQAKDQILRMLDDDTINRDERAMNDLVTMIKSMPLDKRKRILAEFKSETEQEQLAEILQKIRLGVPNVDLIRKTREQLRQFGPQLQQGKADGDHSL